MCYCKWGHVSCSVNYCYDSLHCHSIIKNMVQHYEIQCNQEPEIQKRTVQPWISIGRTGWQDHFPVFYGFPNWEWKWRQQFFVPPIPIRPARFNCWDVGMQNSMRNVWKPISSKCCAKLGFWWMLSFFSSNVWFPWYTFIYFTQTVQSLKKCGPNRACHLNLAGISGFSSNTISKETLETFEIRN